MTDAGRQQQQSPVEVAEAYLHAWNDHDGQAVVATFADGGTYVDPTTPGPVSGDDLKGYVDALVTSFPNLEFVTEGIIANGDRVVRQWRMTGTNTGPPAPTGGTSNLPGVDVITIGPAGIISVVGYFDQLTYFGQLGIEVQVGPPGGESTTNSGGTP